MRALTDRGECGLINSARVELEADSNRTQIGVDLSTLLTGLDFIAPFYDPMTFEVLGEGPGVECHSGTATQPDCMPIFGALGIDTENGSANASANRVFVRR
ncbi:MAG: hypothetical protein AAF658_18035 [Myxococcota bacterium]